MINKLSPAEIEKYLRTKEDLILANKIKCYWISFNNVKEFFCDICESKITGRHFIDGKLANSMEWGLMCPKCHLMEGSGFGEGKGQLYTRTEDDRWLLTYGFTSDQIRDAELDQ